MTQITDFIPQYQEYSYAYSRFINAECDEYESLRKIVIQKQENIRIYYLIYKLYEMLQTLDKAMWRTEILAKAGISESYYGSKYKEPESDVPSKKSEHFVQSIKDILV